MTRLVQPRASSPAPLQFNSIFPNGMFSWAAFDYTFISWDGNEALQFDSPASS